MWKLKLFFLFTTAHSSFKPHLVSTVVFFIVMVSLFPPQSAQLVQCSHYYHQDSINQLQKGLKGRETGSVLDDSVDTRGAALFREAGLFERCLNQLFVPSRLPTSGPRSNGRLRTPIMASNLPFYSQDKQSTSTSSEGFSLAARSNLPGQKKHP